MCGQPLKPFDTQEFINKFCGWGKTGERVVPASPEIIAAQLALCNLHGVDEPLYWGTHPTQPLGSAGFQQLTLKAFQLAGITGRRASPHTLRHTFARICVINGMDISVLKELMGHARIATTEKYLCFAQREIDDKYRRYSPLSHLTDRRLLAADDRLPLADDRLPLADDRLPLADQRISLCYGSVNGYLAELAQTFTRAAELLSGLSEALKRHDGHHSEALLELEDYTKYQARK